MNANQNKAEDSNFYDKYILGTEKLWKNEKAINIKNYFHNGKEIGRIFMNKNSVSYFEIYEDKRLNVLGLSKQITILYIPQDQNNDKHNDKEWFGFRYYEKNIKVKCNYFTLIKKGLTGYYILEKNKEIKDYDGAPFFSENLDCYPLINNIIFEKYKESNLSKKIPIGELFPEILGFTYALISLGKFKNFMILEPFIPDRTNKESLCEKLPKDFEEGIGYFEPILYDDHVSILLIIKEKNSNRKNYLLDMSNHHSRKNIYDLTLFPSELINNLTAYPNKSIQKNNTCGLWYYGILDLIYSNKYYINYKCVLNKIRGNKCDFYVDIINLLSSKIYKITDIINLKKFTNINDIELNRIYDYIDGQNISFSKESINNYFFSLSESFKWSKNNNNIIPGLDLIFSYEKLIEQILNYKKELEVNIEYFKEFYDVIYYEKNIKDDVEDHLIIISNYMQEVTLNFEKEFKNIICDNIEDYITLNEIENDNAMELNKRLKSLKKYKTKRFSFLQENFEDIKKKLTSFHLIDESTIINNINPQNNSIFKVMDK